jgi:hypothetical protein
MEQEHLLDQITTEEIKKPKRPVVVTVMCIIYFCMVGILIAAMLLNSKESWDWSFMIVIAYLVVTIIFIIAIWQMKKWGAYGFFGLTVLSQFAIIAMHNWSLRTLFIPLVCSVILLFQLKKMD